MRHVPALLGRELASYFAGPLAYLMLLAVQVLAFSNVSELMAQLSSGPVLQASLADPMNQYLAASLQFWIVLLFAIPALTMRLFAEEARTGTIEPLLTAPVTEFEVVFAKWLAGTIMAWTLVLPFLVYLPFLHVHYPFDVGPVFSLTIGLATMTMTFVAIGLFFSAQTKSQVAAGTLTFAVLFVLAISGALAATTAVTQRSNWAELLRFVTPLGQANAFGAGQLDLRHVALHVSATAVLLYLTTAAIQARRAA